MPDIFLSQTQLLAVEFLERCVHDLEPLAALTGAAGTGKTIALNTTLARRESAGDRVIRVNNFVAGPLSLHRMVAASLGVPDAGELSAEALEPVLRKALADAGQAEPPVLAVDDAQSLLPETLRYLCLLAGLREAGRPLFRILLVGRPGFTVRQAIPVQFTIEQLSPDDSRELVRHGLAAARVVVRDDTVQEIVQQGQGNLRKLDAALRVSIEKAEKAGLRREPLQAAKSVALEQSLVRPPLRTSAVSWTVPVVVIAGIVGVGIAYHEGIIGKSADRAAGPPGAAAELQVPSPVSTPPTPAPQAAAAPNAPQTQPVSALPPAPPPAPVPSPPQASSAEGPAPRGPAPQGTGPGTPPAESPAPSASLPVPEAPRTGAPGAQSIAAAPASPSPANPATASPALAPTGPAAAVPAPAGTVPGLVHYRVYNISACHHGVCPRWSVTDLGRQSKFVAAFNPSNLNLDRATLQRVREGAIDLLVSGSVRVSDSGARVLSAVTLDSVASHHGRAHSVTPEAGGQAGAEITQSPPPGFLALPSGQPAPAATPSSGPIPLTPPP